MPGDEVVAVCLTMLGIRVNPASWLRPLGTGGAGGGATGLVHGAAAGIAAADTIALSMSCSAIGWPPITEGMNGGCTLNIGTGNWPLNAGAGCAPLLGAGAASQPGAAAGVMPPPPLHNREVTMVPGSSGA